MCDVLVFPTFLLFNLKIFSFKILLKLEDVRAAKEAIQLFLGVSFRYLSQNIWPGSTSKMLSMPRKPSNWGRPTRSAQSTPAHPCAQPHVDYVYFYVRYFSLSNLSDFNNIQISTVSSHSFLCPSRFFITFHNADLYISRGHFPPPSSPPPSLL